MTTPLNKFPEVDSLTLEIAILDQFKGLTNPKKIRKLATKLYGQATNTIQKKLCLDLIKSKDPIAKLEHCVTLIEDTSIIIEELVESGHHGMIIMGKDISPVKIDTLKKWLVSDDRWSLEDEFEIQNRVAEDWLRTNGKTEFLGKVVLFPQFGFSGVPRIIEVVAEYV